MNGQSTRGAFVAPFCLEGDSFLSIRDLDISRQAIAPIPSYLQIWGIPPPASPLESRCTNPPPSVHESACEGEGGEEKKAMGTDRHKKATLTYLVKP